MAGQGIIARFGSRLPAAARQRPLSLGEGDTPLVRIANVAELFGIELDIWCKVEGANPSGSFKDRGMVVAVAAALAAGAEAVVCASTGNTSAAAAAYAARAGLECIVLLPSGKVAAGKLAQARAHGARIIVLEGNFDDAMAAVNQLDDPAIAVVNSTNPMRLQGQKTLAFEVVEQLGRAPDVHALPVGNAGNITAHWIGYSELAGMTTAACALCGGECEFAAAASEGAGQDRPRLLGVQAAGAAPFIAGAPVGEPETVATAIRIGRPQSWDQAKAAIAESNGSFTTVTDAELLAMQRTLAAKVGIFCEPASAAALAGLVKEARAGTIAPGTIAVCTLTGNGLKDPQIFSDDASVETVAADAASLLAAIRG